MEHTNAWRRTAPHAVAVVRQYWHCFLGQATRRPIKLRGCHHRSVLVWTPGGGVLAVRQTRQVQLFSGQDGSLLRVGQFAGNVWLLGLAPDSSEDDLRLYMVYNGSLPCFAHLAAWKTGESLAVTGYLGPMFFGMQHMVVSATGTLYFCDTYNWRVMAVTPMASNNFIPRRVCVVRRPVMSLLTCRDTVLVIQLEAETRFGFELHGFHLVSGQLCWTAFVTAVKVHDSMYPCVATDQSHEIVVLAAPRRLLVYGGADGRLRRTIPLDHSVDTIFAALGNQIGLVSRIKGKKLGSVVTFCE